MNHVTVRKRGEAEPGLQHHAGNPALFECPFCAVDIFRPAEYVPLMTHLAGHKVRAVKHGEYIIYYCGLGCGGKRKHFHCCYCPQTYINKHAIKKHLQIHSLKTSSVKLSQSPGSEIHDVEQKPSVTRLPFHTDQPKPPVTGSELHTAQSKPPTGPPVHTAKPKPPVTGPQPFQPHLHPLITVQTKHFLLSQTTISYCTPSFKNFICIPVLERQIKTEDIKIEDT